jgi:hypothetical protein
VELADVADAHGANAEKADAEFHAARMSATRRRTKLKKLWR